MFKKSKTIQASKAYMELQKQAQEKVDQIGLTNDNPWLYKIHLNNAKIEILSEHLTHQQAEKVITNFAKKHNINIQYDGSHTKNEPITRLHDMQPNSALIVGGKDPMFVHRDAFIKDASGDIICILSYEVSIMWEDKAIYNPAMHYNNDIFKLIENSGKPKHDIKLFPQADGISCFALNLEYIKTLLCQQQKNLNKSLKFKLLNEDNSITKHFIPSAVVLKYSQSDQYNKTMVEFVCANKNTFTLIDQDEKKATILSLRGHLYKTLQQAKDIGNIDLANNTEQLIKNLGKFQKEFFHDYNQIVKEYRKADFIENNVKINQGYGKKVLEQEICRCLDLVDLDDPKEDESSVEEDVVRYHK